MSDPLIGPEATLVSGSTMTPAATSYELRICIWTRDAVGPPAPRTSAHDSAAQMIMDLIFVSDGKLMTEQTDAIVGQFPTLAKAVVAARRIQRCISTWGDTRPEEICCVGIVLRRQAGPRIEGLEAGADASLDFVARGRIVLTEEMGKAMEDLPGVEVKLLDSRPEMSDLGSGTYELVWQSRTADSDMTFAAQQMHQKLIWEMHAVQPETSVKTNTDEPPHLPASMLSHDAAASLAAELAGEDEPPWLARNWKKVAFSAASVAIAALATLVYVTQQHERRRALQENSSSNTQQNSETVGASRTEPPVSTPSGSTTPTPTPDSDAPEASEKPAEAEASKQQSAKPAPSHDDSDGSAADENSQGSVPGSKPVKQEPVQNNRQSSVLLPRRSKSVCEDYARSDVPILLEKAGSDVGSGDYESAKHEYDVVLCLDPNNGKARDGLRRLLGIKE